MRCFSTFKKKAINQEGIKVIMVVEMDHVIIIIEIQINRVTRKAKEVSSLVDHLAKFSEVVKIWRNQLIKTLIVVMEVNIEWTCRTTTWCRMNSWMISNFKMSLTTTVSTQITIKDTKITITTTIKTWITMNRINNIKGKVNLIDLRMILIFK